MEKRVIHRAALDVVQGNARVFLAMTMNSAQSVSAAQKNGNTFFGFFTHRLGSD